MQDHFKRTTCRQQEPQPDVNLLIDIRLTELQQQGPTYFGNGRLDFTKQHNSQKQSHFKLQTPIPKTLLVDDGKQSKAQIKIALPNLMNIYYLLRINVIIKVFNIIKIRKIKYSKTHWNQGKLMVSYFRFGLIKQELEQIYRLSCNSAAQLRLVRLI